MTNSKAIIDAIVESGEESRRIVDREGTHWVDSNGDLHRVDGPAIESSDGSTSWYIH